MSNQTNQPEELTPEQIAELKAKQLEYLESSIPFLAKQVEYEELRARLAVAKFTQTENTVKLAQYLSQASPKQTEK